MWNPQDIIASCEANFAANAANCSGLVKAVAAALGVPLTGLANDIVDQIRTGSWVAVPDGRAAKTRADAGCFVIAAMKGADQSQPDPHGHVVVVVSGPLDPTHNAYPTCYWGRLNGVGEHPGFLNFAWNTQDRDRVTYACLTDQP